MNVNVKHNLKWYKDLPQLTVDSATLHFAKLLSFAFTVYFSTVDFSTVLHCILLHCIVLHCTAHWSETLPQIKEVEWERRPNQTLLCFSTPTLLYFTSLSKRFREQDLVRPPHTQPRALKRGLERELPICVSNVFLLSHPKSWQGGYMLAKQFWFSSCDHIWMRWGGRRRPDRLSRLMNQDA